MRKISILGDGSWGTACATILAHNQIPVTLWCYNADVATAIREKQENTTYLSGISLDTDYIHPTTSYQEAVLHADEVYYAIPVTYLRNVLHQCTRYMHKHQIWASLSKGIEQDTGYLPTQMLADIAPIALTHATVAGASFAKEVAMKKPTGMTCACKDSEAAFWIMQHMATEYVTLSHTQDVIGVHVTGALKNVYAIAAGMLDAISESANARALCMTRAYTELRRMTEALGGRPKTLETLAGIGDLILTCQSSQSRNYTLGYAIGSGTSLKQHRQSTETVAEGANTAISAHALCKRHNVALPIITAVHNILYKDKPVEELIDTLMQWDVS